MMENNERFRAPSLLLVMLLASTPAAAGADNEGDRAAQARRLFSQGLKLFSTGKYDQALERFSRSSALVPHLNKQYNIAECHRRLGKLRQSHKHYKQYAGSLKGDKQAAFMAKLERLRLGTASAMSVTSTPGGAQVTVNGKLAGTTPRDGAALSLSLSGGSYRVTLSLAGHRPASRTVAAEFGEPIPLSFALQPLPRPVMLDVRASVPGASVRVDGEPAGRVPLQLSLAPGKHRVEVLRQGYRTVERTFEARAGATEQMYLELRREPNLDPGETTRPEAPPRVEPKPASGGLFVAVSMGPTWADYGDPLPEVSAATQLGLRLGWLWRLGRLGLTVDASLLATPVTDALSDDSAWFVALLGGGGARFYFWRDAWVGLHFALGLNTLHGAGAAMFLFQHSAGVEGAFTTLALRPEITAGWTVFSGLTVYLTPFALDYSPAHALYTDNIKRVLRYQVGLGVGWQM